MASSGRSSAPDGLGGDLGPAAVKGGILIFVALALGALLLVRGPESDLGAADTPSSEDQRSNEDDDSSVLDEDDDSDTTSDTTAAPETTTTTAVEARPPGEVTVLVANGSGAPGVAGTAKRQLEALGYLVVEPDNVKDSELGQPTAVYFITGFEAEARAVAEVFGLDPDDEGVVAPMPTPLPTQDENLGAANILVVIGPDVTPVEPDGTATDTDGGTGDATTSATTVSVE